MESPLQIVTNAPDKRTNFHVVQINMVSIYSTLLGFNIVFHSHVRYFGMP